jgi:trans-aconitate 2-methyltransferase
MDWNPAQYAKFEAERNRPVRDLLAQIPRSGIATAVDLGCGPGNSTELLRNHLPEAAVTGLDSSPAMVEAARVRLPGTTFRLGDIASWAESGERPDLLFANASLQWLPDHAALLPRLVAALPPGGRLAVQVPDNLDEPAHHLMREVARSGPWAATLADAAEARAARHGPDWYVRVLRAAGAQVDIWRTTYHHHLTGLSALVEWFRGTGLRPFLQRLDPAGEAAFLDRYRAALTDAYPVFEDGSVLLPFPRLFFVAQRTVA